MATEWYLMGSSPVYNSGFEKEEFNMFATDSFNEILETSPISETVQIVNHDVALISEIEAVILNNVADSSQKSKERLLLSTIGTLQCGDYIKFENLIWMITSFVGNNKIYEKAIMELCTYTINFQSPDGSILSYPCIDSTNATVGVEEGKVISTGSAIHTIKLPFDKNTVLLDTDDRFFIDDLTVEKPQVFAISKPNRTEFKYGDKGLIELTMKQGEYNPDTDRKDLGVCNYVEPNTNPLPPEGNSYAKLSIDGSLILGGKPRTITSIFYDSNDAINNEVIAVWDVAIPIGYEQYFTITYVDSTCTVQVSDENYDILDYSPITVNVSDGNGVYNGSIKVDLESGW